VAREMSCCGSEVAISIAGNHRGVALQQAMTIDRQRFGLTEVVRTRATPTPRRAVAP
jgi:hypothetical protein